MSSFLYFTERLGKFKANKFYISSFQIDTPSVINMSMSTAKQESDPKFNIAKETYKIKSQMPTFYSGFSYQLCTDNEEVVLLSKTNLLSPYKIIKAVKIHKFGVIQEGWWGLCEAWGLSFNIYS